MKKLFAFTALAILWGCAESVDSRQLEEAKNLCSAHGGPARLVQIEALWYGARLSAACKDGAVVSKYIEDAK